MLHPDRLAEGTKTRLSRVAAGLSQRELASQAGVDRRRLSEYERGERPLPEGNLARVRGVLVAAGASLANTDDPRKPSTAYDRTSGRDRADHSAIYRQALADCRFRGNAELGAFIEAHAYELADFADLYGGDDVARFLAGERLRAGRDERARRERLHRTGHDVSDPRAASNDAWRELAQQVRERVDVALVLEHGGYELRPAGTNGRRGAREFCGACPVGGRGKRMEEVGMTTRIVGAVRDDRTSSPASSTRKPNGSASPKVGAAAPGRRAHRRGSPRVFGRRPTH